MENKSSIFLCLNRDGSRRVCIHLLWLLSWEGLLNEVLFFKFSPFSFLLYLPVFPFFSMVLGIKPKHLFMLGKHSTTEIHPQPYFSLQTYVDYTPNTHLHRHFI